MFQFLVGRLKIIERAALSLSVAMFQFLVGRLKICAGSRSVSSVTDSFNSS